MGMSSEKWTYTGNVSPISSKDLLSIISGIRITNNWLKMHGGVMSRRYKNDRDTRTKKL